MDEIADTKDPSIESEFVRMYKYIDLYFQQKTDLFLQHYVLEPFDLLFKRIMYLSVIVTLLAGGTLALILGTILFISIFVPLWAALLIMGAIVFAIGGIIAQIILSDKIILKTPSAETIDHGKT
jgi:hypothetical protein